jgi:hypothetical protein
VRKLAFLVATAAIVSGCGGKKAVEPTTTADQTPRPSPGRLLYDGGSWAVTIDHGRALALRLTGNRWRVDASRRLKIDVLGPRPHELVGSTPQVAVQLRAPGPLIESGLWVDGAELEVKGGGASPTVGTIYGGPLLPLKPGRHTAVAFGRTAGTATAVTWSFRVR